MSHIKRYFEEHIDEFTDEQLSDWGWSSDDIKIFRECFSKAKERNIMDCENCTVWIEYFDGGDCPFSVEEHGFIEGGSCPFYLSKQDSEFIAKIADKFERVNPISAEDLRKILKKED